MLARLALPLDVSADELGSAPTSAVRTAARWASKSPAACSWSSACCRSSRPLCPGPWTPRRSRWRRKRRWFTAPLGDEPCRNRARQTCTDLSPTLL